MRNVTFWKHGLVAVLLFRTNIYISNEGSGISLLAQKKKYLRFVIVMAYKRMIALHV